MKRLDFLQKGAYAAASAVVGGSLLSSVFGLSGCASVSDSSKIIGLQLYSLRNAMGEDVVGTLKLISEMGYKSLETASYNDGKLYGYSPVEFKKIVEDLGMKVTSAHLGQSYDAEKDAEIMEWWNVALDAQAAAGCKYAIQPSFPIGETLDDIKVYSDYFNRISELAAKKGLVFGFHNHHREFETRGDEVILDYLIKNAAPNMFFQLDVYWALKGGVDPSEFIKKHSAKIPVLHIKDESIIGDSGILDFESIFNTAYSVGINDYYVEVERYTPLPAEGCVQKSFDFLEAATYVK